MIKITAKINIFENSGQLNDVSSEQSGINVSSSLAYVKGRHEQIQRPFILGRSKLGSGDCFTKKANFFISSKVSDEDGNFPTEVQIHISGSNISVLTIIFNKQKNEYPQFISINDENFYDDDPTWTIPLTGGNEYTIKINNWNKPFSPLVISSIYTDLSIDLDESNLLDFECTIMDRSDIEKPSYGITSNTGRLSFIDKNGEVLDYITQRLISSESVITAYLKNTETKAEEQIGYFNTQQWSYNNSLPIVNVELKDDLEEWQDINVPAVNYVPTVSTSKTAEYFYIYLHGKTPEKYKMLAFKELDEQTKDVLSGTIIQYPLLESSNLWAEWTKLCQLCFLYIYKRSDGKTICKAEV